MFKAVKNKHFDITQVILYCIVNRYMYILFNKYLKTKRYMLQMYRYEYISGRTISFPEIGLIY